MSFIYGLEDKWKLSRYSHKNNMYKNGGVLQDLVGVLYKID